MEVEEEEKEKKREEEQRHRLSCHGRRANVFMSKEHARRTQRRLHTYIHTSARANAHYHKYKAHNTRIANHRHNVDPDRSRNHPYRVITLA